MILVIKLTRGDESWYMGWSNTLAAPLTPGYPLEGFRAFMKEEYGRKGLEEFDNHLTLIDQQTSNSFKARTAEQIIASNRAGENGSRLTKDQIIEAYCQPVANTETPNVEA